MMEEDVHEEADRNEQVKHVARRLLVGLVLAPEGYDLALLLCLR